MPPTSEPDPPTVLISGLEDFGLAAFEPAADAAVRAVLETQTRLPPDGAEISLTFVDDSGIAELNREWLSREGPTDVIAFGLGDAPLVADVYVSAETARRNAGHHGITPREELLRLVVHGVLHAAGYDHPDGDERFRSEMFELQERLVIRLLGGQPET